MRSLEQSAEFVALYRRAFADYGARALWNLRAFEAPTPEDGLVVARALRVEGDCRRDLSRKRLSESAVALSKIQIDILRLLASKRDPT